MDLIWNINKKDLKVWERFVKNYIDTEFVIERKQKNILRQEIDLSKESLWNIHIGCQITTQQRSGKNSKVEEFMNSNNPILNYSSCLKALDKKKFFEDELSNNSIWRAKIISKNLSSIISKLETGEWEILLQNLETILINPTKEKERKVANYIKENFKGIGLKQSRNYIQWLGLSKFEIPIDSRTTKTIKKLGFNFVPNSKGLSDENVYLIIQKGLQYIANELKIYPCILDACIFVSANKKD